MLALYRAAGRPTRSTRTPSAGRRLLTTSASIRARHSGGWQQAGSPRTRPWSRRSRPPSRRRQPGRRRCLRIRSTVEPPDPRHSTRLIGRAVEQPTWPKVWDRARLATVLGHRGRQDPTRPRAGPAADPSAWYVALEQIPAAQSVAAAILDVVAPSSRATDASRGIRTALGTASGLLVLDGCEGRPVEIAREVGQILGCVPPHRVLATSRERLGILDEALIPLAR